VHDRDEIRHFDRVRAEESAAKIGGKCTDPARARRERGDDRGAHALASVPGERIVVLRRHVRSADERERGRSAYPLRRLIDRKRALADH